MKLKLFILLIFFTVVTSFSQDREKKLISYSFQEVSDLQKEEQRPIVVFIHTDWCKYCKAMKKNTFSDNKIIELLNNRCYFISLNAETKENIKFNNTVFKYKPTGTNTGIHELAEILAKHNNQVSYPTTVILNNKNKVLYKEASFLTKKKMLLILNQKIKGES